MQAVRYRLEGIAYENGQVSLQARPEPMPINKNENGAAGKEIAVDAKRGFVYVDKE